PVIMESGHFTGYLAGDIDIAADLTQVFDTVIASTSSPIVVQAVAPDHRLVFSSLMSVTNAAAMAQDGALSQVVHTPSVDTALRTGSQPGALGYGQDESFGWAITATEPSSVALAPVSRGQGLAALMLLGGVGLLAIALFII